MSGTPNKQDYTVHYTAVSGVLVAGLISIINEELLSGQSLAVRIGVAFLIALVWMTATVWMLKRMQRRS
ncbi:MAG: hypothetical protein U0796_04495 [Gemmatales bacterium]